MSYFAPLQLVAPPTGPLLDLPLPAAVQLVLVGLSVFVSALLLAVSLHPGAGSAGLALRPSAPVLPGSRLRPGKTAPSARRPRSSGARRAAQRRSSDRGGTRVP